MFRPGMRFLLVAATLAMGTALPSPAQSPLLETNELAAIDTALRCLKMSRADLGFKKDYSEAPFRLGSVQRLLEFPHDVPIIAASTRDRLVAPTSIAVLITSFAEVLERRDGAVNIVGPLPLALDPASENAIPPSIRPIVQDLVTGIGFAKRFLDHGFKGVPVEARRRAMARYFATHLRLDQDTTERTGLERVVLGGSILTEMLAQDEALESDDDAYARDLLPVFAATLVGENGLMAAATTLAGEVERAAKRLAALDSTNDVPPKAKLKIDTRHGTIFIGGSGPTHYTEDALLIIDLGGDDLYECHAAAANGLLDRPISIVIDVAGNDTYRSGSLSQGAGVFGVGILVDCAGDDIYESKHLAQGCGLYGVGILADHAGNDTYTGDINVQGAGMFGVGILWDKNGDDKFTAQQSTQGYGYTDGLGLLLDSNGNDTYKAGGKYADHERQPEHSLTASQGFGIGMRPDASGGVGILCDLAGNDSYTCDIYGQGVGYFYSLGMLLDASGNDTYRSFQYGQGAGIHLAAGILADWDGDDQYIAGHIVQGAAHDWSVGMLIDKRGNDRYEALSTAQGSALYNSVAMLIDSTGNDSYETPIGSNTQAAGHDGSTREYGSIGLLLDLDGKDQYTNGPRDNFIAIKPLHGCALDWDRECGRRLSAPTPPFIPDSRRAEAPPTFKPGDSFASSPTEFSRLRNDQEQRWLKLIRQAAQYPDTPRKAKDKALAFEVLHEESPEVLPFWLRQLDRDNVMTRVRLEELLEDMGNEKVAPAILEALESPNESIRRGATYFAGKLGLTGAAGLVRQQLAFEKIRATALWTLGEIKDAESFDSAVQLLRDEKEIVRVRAAGVLGKLRDPRAIPHLVAALDDDLWDVRYAAQSALLRIGRPAVKPIIDALPAATDRARPYLIEALGKSADPRAARAIRPFIRSDNWLDRGTAVQAARNLDAYWLRFEFRRLRKAETNLFVRSRLEEK